MAHGTTKSIQWLWIAVFFLFIGQTWMNERENMILNRLNNYMNDMKIWETHRHQHKHYYSDQYVYDDHIEFINQHMDPLPWNTPEENGRKKKKKLDRKEN